MKEYPILFSTPMIRAILNNTKSQTRRIVKPQPQENDHSERLGKFWWKGQHGWDERQLIPFCPYGQVGDVLTELLREATIRKIRIVQKEGNRDVARDVDFYNVVFNF